MGTTSIHIGLDEPDSLMWGPEKTSPKVLRLESTPVPKVSTTLLAHKRVIPEITTDINELTTTHVPARELAPLACEATTETLKRAFVQYGPPM